MLVPKHTTGSLVARFLLKKVLVYVLILIGASIFMKNALTGGYYWLVLTFLLWCLVDSAELYGDVWAYADLRSALTEGRDPESLVEPWIERDTSLHRFDASIMIVVGIALILMGMTKWVGIVVIIFGAFNLVRFVAEADPRDVQTMLKSR